MILCEYYPVRLALAIMKDSRTCRLGRRIGQESRTLTHLSAIPSGRGSTHLEGSQCPSSLGKLQQFCESAERLSTLPKFKQAASIFDLTSDAILELEQTRLCLRECRHIAEVNGSGIPDSFARTMLCGLTAAGHPVPDQYLKQFERYLAFMEHAPEVFSEYLSESSLEGLRALDEWNP